MHGSYISKQAVGAEVGLNVETTDGCFVDGICEGPEGDIDGTTGCRLEVGKTVGQIEDSAVGKHLLKVLSSLGTCTKLLVVPYGTP